MAFFVVVLRTPLHCAAFYNDKQLCTYLVENGASVFATTYTDYQTPAHKCSRLDDNYDECFAYLHGTYPTVFCTGLYSMYFMNVNSIFHYM